MDNNLTTEVLTTIRQFLEDNDFDTKSLDLDTNLMKDYELDSLDYLDLFNTLETEFDVDFPERMQNYDSFFSIKKLVDYINENKDEKISN